MAPLLADHQLMMTRGVLKLAINRSSGMIAPSHDDANLDYLISAGELNSIRQSLPTLKPESRKMP